MKDSFYILNPELTKDLFRQLAFMTWHGEMGPNSKCASDYRKRYRVSTAKYDDNIQKLLSLNILQTTSFVNREYQLEILIQLIKNHSDWLEDFKKLCPYGRSSTTADYLSKIAELIINNDFESVRKLSRPYSGLGHELFNLFKYVERLATEDTRYLRILNDDEIGLMIDEILKEKFNNDELDDALFDNLASFIRPSLKSHDALTDEILTYKYFHSGKLSKTSGKTMWSQALSATISMYEGRLTESYEEFQKAKRFLGRNSAFPCVVFNYAYGILLYRLSKKEQNHTSYQDSLSAFTRTSHYKYCDDNFCIRTILENIDLDPVAACKNVNKKTELILNKYDCKGYRVWSYLLCRFFGCSNVDKTDTIPNSAILQHELSTWLPAGQDAKESNRNSFHGNPLISTIRKTESWEVMLTDLSSKLKKEVTSIDRRIVYYVTGKSLHAIWLQEKSEESQWTDKALLSLSGMMAGEYDFADFSDIAIANGLYKNRHENHECSDIDILVPYLYGTGRLLFGNVETQGNEAIIRQEKPYLKFDGDGNNIDISSNLTVDSQGNIPHHIVRMTGPGEYSLIKTNVLQRDIVRRFLLMKHFPSTALNSLRKAIASIKGIIDIYDENITKIQQMEYMSKGIMAVRISPAPNMFDIEIQATAIEDGTGRFPPADGEKIVFDDVHGLTHCIERDFTKEHDNYQVIDSFLVDTAYAERCGFSKYRLSEEGLLNLLEFVYGHKGKYFAEWPEGTPMKFRGTISAEDIDIQVKSNVEWFSVEGIVRIGGMNHSLESLIRNCCNSTFQNYIKISDDEFVRISDKLKKHIALLETFPTEKKKKKVPKYQMGALANVLKKLHYHSDKAYTSFMEKTKSAFALHAEVPPTLNATLRPYQKEGFQWLCRLNAWGAGACLADDMGLGKTLQMLAFLLYKAAEGPSLVVAPKSVIQNWMSEAKRFTPTLHTILLNEETNRHQAIKDSKKDDVVLCTYGLLTTEGELLEKKEWNVICLDEAHQIKNRQTAASHAAMQLHAGYRVILTGTPLQNNLSELWNLFQFINPGLLNTWPVFRDSFVAVPPDEEHREMLKDLTQPFILRRTKHEVLQDLPEKTILTHMVEQTDKELEVYEEMRRLTEIKFKDKKTRAERNEAKELRMNFFTELMKLRQAACSMRLVYTGWKEQSSKIEELMNLLDDIVCNEENNVIIFSQFTSFLEMVKPEFKKRNWDFLYLDGQTPMDKRKEIVVKFQKGESRIFLSSLKAGGLGINLTAANYVILLDPWWNPAIENQAMDRAHRIGQKREVTVIRLITCQTIEEKILRLHERKQELSDEILDGTSDSWQLTYEDILDMVSPF